MKTILPLWGCIAALLLSSCGHSDDPEPLQRRTLLIYAVASNSLSSDLVKDKDEMLVGAQKIPGIGKNIRVLVYEVPSTSATDCVLSEIKKDKNGNCSFIPMKKYDRSAFSTDPIRMSAVFSDVSTLAPADNYGLVFWSHGTGWLPNFADHVVPASDSSKSPAAKSFGYDKYNGKVDYCDLKELERAIPEGMFDYIWFDCCYMMCIETAYQLRYKCEYVAGYPTEDWDTGMNYDETLPYLAALRPDLPAAADAFFKYYDSQNTAATVTVASTAQLDWLADITRRIYDQGERPPVSLLQNYSRLGYGLYDFGQYASLHFRNAEDEDDLVRLLKSALNTIVVYGNCTAIDFNRRPLDPSVYSGFSCHYPGLMTSETEETYYNSLDWPRAVYK